MNLFNRRRYGIFMLGLLGIGITSLLPADEKTDSFISELLKNVKSYQKEIEDIRGKKFKADVSVEIQSKEDFIKWFRKLAEDKSKLQAKKTDPRFEASARIKLGLVPQGYYVDATEMDAKDIHEYEEQEAGALYDQAGAMYVPTTKKVYLNRIRIYNTITETLVAVKAGLVHELCHALDDQYFGWATLGENAGESLDAQIALKFLEEGTAIYLMSYYTAKSMLGNRPAPSGASFTQLISKTVIQTYSSTSLEDIMNNEPDMKGRPPILRLDPKTESRYLLWCKYAPYTSGTASIAEMMLMSVPVNKGVSATGWVAVDLAWAKPPLSTEQMLHPRKLLVERDDPAPVNQPVLPDGWEPAYSNALGEFGFRILFETFGFKQQQCFDYAEGWDGDRYTLIKNKKDNRLSLHFATAWDSEKDALESFKAYQQIISKKYPGGVGKTNITITYAAWTSPDNKSVVLMFRDGAKWTAVEDIPVEDMELWQKTPLKTD